MTLRVCERKNIKFEARQLSVDAFDWWKCRVLTFKSGFHMLKKSKMICNLSQILLIYLEIIECLSRWIRDAILFVTGGYWGQAIISRKLKPSQNILDIRKRIVHYFWRLCLGSAPIFRILLQTIPDSRECLRFWVFISQKTLGWSGNSKIFNHLRFFV